MEDDEQTSGSAEALLEEGINLFNAGHYHDAHDSWEEVWLASRATDGDFFKGLIQAAICLHHFERANLRGTRKLYVGHRRYLAEYSPAHKGVDVSRLLADMESFVGPVLEAEEGAAVPWRAESSPKIRRA